MARTQSIKMPKRTLAQETSNKNGDAIGLVADYVPLLAIVDEKGTLLLKDGSLAMVFRLRGKDTETLTQEEKDLQSATLYDLLRQFGGDMMLWTTILRREVTRNYGDKFVEQMPQQAHDDYIKQFADTPAYENDVYLTLVYQTDLRSRSVFDRISAYVEMGRNVPVSILLALRDSVSGKKQYQHSQELFQTSYGLFQQKTAEFTANMRQFDIEALCQDNEIFTLYRRLANPSVKGEVNAPASPATPACGWIAESEIKRAGGGFAPNTLLFETAGQSDKYCTALAVHEWAESISAGGLDEILSIPGEFTITIVCAFMDDESAQKMLSGLENKIAMSFENFSQLMGRAISKGSNDEGGSGLGREMRQNEVREANARTIYERLKWGQIYVSVLCLGDSPDAANAASVDVAAACRRARFTLHEEKLHLLQAWSASLPGQYGGVIGWCPLPIDYLSDIVPLRSLDSGEKENLHFTKIRGKHSPALSVFRTFGGGDYYLDLHAGSAGRRDSDIGHFACIAPTSRGKSVLMNWLIYQFRRYDPCRIIVLDKDLSCKIPILLQGGDYLETGSNSNSGGTPLTLNPLSLLADDKHTLFLAGWLSRLLAGEGVTVTPDEITKSLNMLRSADKGNWSLSTLAPFLPQNAAQALKPWLAGGVYGDLDSNGEDSFQRQMQRDSYCVGIDLKRIFDDPHFAPVCLDYLLYSIDQATSYGDGATRPGLLYIEESWKVLGIPRLAGQIEDWLRTLRKKNFAVGLTTQSLREIRDSGLFEILIDSIPNKFFLGTPDAPKQADLYATFGLNEEDTQALAQMTVGQFMYLKSGKLKKRLKFTPPSSVLKMLSVNEAALTEFNRTGTENYISKGDLS